MTIRFKKKNKRQRGLRWHGWGSKKKHRGGGSRGGRGKAGFSKHKWSYMIRHEPDHFNKKGFHSRKKKIEIINLKDISKLKGNQVDLGNKKVLGSGNIRKMTIKAKIFSARAKEKIEKAGGRAVVG